MSVMYLECNVFGIHSLGVDESGIKFLWDGIVASLSASLKNGVDLKKE